MAQPWTRYHPTFDFDQTHDDLLRHSAWVGHRAFAYGLVRYLKPSSIVELGTHYGISFFVFCQAMTDEGLRGTCMAIDTWRGDKHSGFYADSVYEVVNTYAKQYSCAILKRDTFDDALSKVRNESVDILHIDGLHTYEAVKHDFKSWLPKLSPYGVVLFHDIDIKAADFGVYKLWRELKSTYPHHLEFHHTYGLGVIFPKGLSEAGHYVVENQANIIAHYP